MPLASYWQYLIELPGLSVEFWGLVLTHNHQHRTGWTHRPRWSHLQAPPRAVSLSIFPGGESSQDTGDTGLRLGLEMGRGQTTHRVMCRGAFWEVAMMGSRS